MNEDCWWIATGDFGWCDEIWLMKDDRAKPGEISEFGDSEKRLVIWTQVEVQPVLSIDDGRIAARWLSVIIAMEDRYTPMRGVNDIRWVLHAMRPPFLQQRKSDVFQARARWPDRTEVTSKDGSMIGTMSWWQYAARWPLLDVRSYPKFGIDYSGHGRVSVCNKIIGDVYRVADHLVSASSNKKLILFAQPNIILNRVW